MNRLKLFYQLIILIGSYQCGLSADTYLRLQSIALPNEGIIKQDVLLIKTENEDEYYFNDEQLNSISSACFSTQQLEVRSVHDKFLSFSLPNVNTIVKCEFAEIRDLQLFFIDIRKDNQMEDNEIRIRRLFKYQIGSPNIIPVATGIYFYAKPIPMSAQVGATTSFNLVRRYFGADDFQPQEADLVFLSGKAALTPKIEQKYYGLCIEDFPDFVFILHFYNDSYMTRFYNTVERHLNRTMACSLDWVNRGNINYLNEFNVMILPLTPYYSGDNYYN